MLSPLSVSRIRKKRGKNAALSATLFLKASRPVGARKVITRELRGGGGGGCARV